MMPYPKKYTAAEKAKMKDKAAKVAKPRVIKKAAALKAAKKKGSK